MLEDTSGATSKKKIKKRLTLVIQSL